MSVERFKQQFARDMEEVCQARMARQWRAWRNVYEPNLLAVLDQAPKQCALALLGNKAKTSPGHALRTATADCIQTGREVLRNMYSEMHRERWETMTLGGLFAEGPYPPPSPEELEKLSGATALEQAITGSSLALLPRLDQASSPKDTLAALSWWRNRLRTIGRTIAAESFNRLRRGV